MSRGAELVAPLAAVSTASALLSVDESVRRAKLLRAWSIAQHQAIEQVLGKVLNDWQAAWDARSDRSSSGQVRVQPVEVSPHDKSMRWMLTSSAASTSSSRPLPRWGYSESQLADTKPADFPTTSVFTDPETKALHALQVAMFGEAVRPVTASIDGPLMALEIAQSAWEDWWQRLGVVLDLSSLTSGGTRDAAPAPGFWSGALEVQISWWGARIRLLLDGSSIQQILNDHAPESLKPHLQATSGRAPASVKVGVVQALSGNTVELRAELNAVELSLGQIQALILGDVIPIPHRLDAPAKILDRDGRILCVGWLGKQQTQMAVELARQFANE